MTENSLSNHDPMAAERRMRSRILGGARPALDQLSADELAAAQGMLLSGEAEITCYACRQFLIAAPEKGPSGLASLKAAVRRYLKST